jgi:hypothetical protein
MVWYGMVWYGQFFSLKIFYIRVRDIFYSCNEGIFHRGKFKSIKEKNIMEITNVQQAQSMSAGEVVLRTVCPVPAMVFDIGTALAHGKTAKDAADDAKANLQETASRDKAAAKKVAEPVVMAACGGGVLKVLYKILTNDDEKAAQKANEEQKK